MSGPADRMEKLALGIAGVSLGRTSRQIPADDSPPMPPNADLSIISKSIPRVSGHAMVTGAARYTADIKLPGMLFARILRSPHPHARILLIDTSAAERHPDVRAVHVVSEDGRGNTRSSSGGAFPNVRYVGAGIAAIAATTRHAAEEALRLIKVDYETLPFVVDMDEARQPNAPRVFDDSDTGANRARASQSANVLGPRMSSFFWRAARRRHTRLQRSGLHRRRGISHPGADALLSRAARHRCRLAAKRSDRLHLQPHSGQKLMV